MSLNWGSSERFHTTGDTSWTSPTVSLDGCVNGTKAARQYARTSHAWLNFPKVVIWHGYRFSVGLVFGDLWTGDHGHDQRIGVHVAGCRVFFVGDCQQDRHVVGFHVVFGFRASLWLGGRACVGDGCPGRVGNCYWLRVRA